MLRIDMLRIDDTLRIDTLRIDDILRIDTLRIDSSKRERGGIYGDNNCDTSMSR